MIRITSTIVISCLLAACGGGGGGDAGGGAGVAAGNGQAVAVDNTGPTVGDFQTYKMTGYGVSNGNNRYNYQAAYDTDLTTAVAGGSATVKTFYGDQLLEWFDDSVTLKGVYQGSKEVSCTTTYAAATYGPPAALALNVSWDNSTSFTRDCRTKNPLRNSKLSSKGAVVGVERISVAAGTFQAYKLVATVNEQRTDNYLAGGTSSPISSMHASKLTAWIDVDTGIEIKRSIEETVTGFLDSYVYTRDRELVGLSHAKSGRQVLVVDRFASPSWQGSYSGKLSGTCSAFIFEGGEIVARCSASKIDTGSFSKNGTISNSGQVSIALPASGGSPLTLTGKAESLTKISGTWSDNAGATGTWVMTRDN